MGRGWRDLDKILRGEATRLPSLKQGTIDASIWDLARVLLPLAMLYGLCMGSYSLFRGSHSAYFQVTASTLKVPALFVLTLIVTFPSLYVFNALVGSRLALGALLRLLVASLGVIVAVLASLGPIVAFFAASTTSYPFMQLLNVAAFGVAGFLGMAFLLQTLHRLSLPSPDVPAVEPREVAGEAVEALPSLEQTQRPPGALERVDERVLSRHVKLVFRCWIVLFGLVGAQMGWVLRPFIGNPSIPFAWFRARESNIFLAVLKALADLFNG